MMNNLPDEDPQLTNFLRQNRSISPPSSPELEDRLMSEIDRLPIVTRQQFVTRSWWRYIAGGIGIIATGIVGVSIQQIISPPEPSMAEIQQLNLFLEAHARDSIFSPDANVESPDLDVNIFADNEPEDS
ncbi:hypothetical protein [Chamaesiphon minutus]|uniref:Uncharacterized protein n=1 Tax=Chamaesiphon minutus (strain ATCC 27169 / PCC 6605) TaxID=1173020 RepID=K9ULF8_CHAP6|nr:hypothetical protein [Chamaesiphon minutus]AFY95498.1 hypothetical protein Cha6605_4579 [Chamaesiphon minutus PCC 6605]